MHNTDIELDTVTDLAYEADLDVDDVFPAYSGRGMYGEQCLGLVCNIGQFARFVQQVSRRVAEGDDELAELEAELPNVRTDSMGLGTIYYWPGIQVTS